MDNDDEGLARRAIARHEARFDPPLRERSLCQGEAVEIDGLVPLPDATVTQRFVVAPDPQYPRLDNDRVAESSTETAQARQTLQAYYKAIASYRTTHGGASQIPVFINGDIVEQGDPGHLNIVYGFIRDELDNKAYVGLGNHDCDLPSYFGHGTRMTRSCFRHVRFLKEAGVPMDLWESGSGDPFW